MKPWVIDASTVCEVLLGTVRGTNVRTVMGDGHLMAPQLLVPEVLSVLRGWILGGHLSPERAQMALVDFRALGVELWGMEELMTRAWGMRNNLPAYDAMYVALARELRVQVLSCDETMARAAPSDVVLPAPPAAG